MNQINSQITFKTKTIQEKSLRGYKVYKNSSEFVNVEAETASEAIEKSGVTNPYKLEKLGIVNKSLFSEAELVENVT